MNKFEYVLGLVVIIAGWEALKYAVTILVNYY